VFCRAWLLLPVLLTPVTASAQRTYTWQELRDKFQATNPTLRAGNIGIEE